MSEAYQRGSVLYQHRRYDLAAEEFRRALQAAPDDGRAMAMLALSLTSLNQFAAAAVEARRAIAAAPTLGFAHYAMSIAILRTPLPKRRRAFRLELSRGSNERRATLRRLRDARVPSVEAVRLEPDNCDFLSLLASIEIDRGKSDVALALVDRSLSRNPNHERSANLRVIALRMRSRDEEARHTAGRALAVNPENAQTHLNHGWLDLYAGNGPAALQHFGESLRLDPANKQALIGRRHAEAMCNPIRRPFKRANLWLNRTIGPNWMVRMALIAYFVISSLTGVDGERNSVITSFNVAAIVLLFFSFPIFRWWKRRRLRRITQADPKTMQEIFK